MDHGGRHHRWRNSNNSKKIKLMYSFNFGPNWFWRLLFILAAIGLILGIIKVIHAIIWIFHHVQIN